MSFASTHPLPPDLLPPKLRDVISWRKDRHPFMVVRLYEDGSCDVVESMYAATERVDLRELAKAATDGEYQLIWRDGSPPSPRRAGFTLLSEREWNDAVVAMRPPPSPPPAKTFESELDVAKAVAHVVDQMSDIVLAIRRAATNPDAIKALDEALARLGNIHFP